MLSSLGAQTFSSSEACRAWVSSELDTNSKLVSVVVANSDSRQERSWINIRQSIETPWFLVVVYYDKTRTADAWGYLCTRQWLAHPSRLAPTWRDALVVFRADCKPALPAFSACQWSWSLWSRDPCDPLQREVTLTQLERALAHRLQLYRKLNSDERLAPEDVFLRDDAELCLDQMAFLFVWAFLPAAFEHRRVAQWEAAITQLRWDTCFSWCMEPSWTRCNPFLAEMRWERSLSGWLLTSIPFEQATDLLRGRDVAVSGGSIRAHVGVVYAVMRAGLRRAQWTDRLKQPRRLVQDGRLAYIRSMVEPGLRGLSEAPAPAERFVADIEDAPSHLAPCMANLWRAAREPAKSKASKRYLTNHWCFVLTSYLLSRGARPESVVRLFRSRARVVFAADDAETNRHNKEIGDQVNRWLAKKRQGRAQYSHGCAALSQWCPYANSDSVTEAQRRCGARHPLQWQVPRPDNPSAGSPRAS